MLEQFASSEDKMAPCVVCGGTIFEPGPSGRLARGTTPPRCKACRSLERHRALRLIYNAIPDRFLSGASCLQFARDPAVQTDRFKRYELSVYEEENSLNMMAIDKPDASYDWIIANHVVEHLSDDMAGMSELMRIAGPRGIVQITVPAPKARLVTEVMPVPDQVTTFHYHTYGSDFPRLINPVLNGAAGIQVISADQSTHTWDVAYFFCASREHLHDLGMEIIKRRFPVLDCN